MSREAYLMVRFSKDLTDDVVNTRRRLVDVNLAGQRLIEERRSANRKPMTVSAAPKMAEEMAHGRHKRAFQAFMDSKEPLKLGGPKPVHHPIPEIKVPELDLSRLHDPIPSKKVLIGSAALGGAIGGAAVYRKQRAKRKLKGG